MRVFLFTAALLVSGMVQGAEPDGIVEKIDSAVAITSRAGRATPVTYSTISREELRESNPINSLPMSLALQPSVISVNEGGTGLGYSKMTVRGVKGAQINVTLNGITLNDAESQEVFWVNIPALSGILSSVQLQRGLGTSASGPGAFGASVNMSTSYLGADPYGAVDIGYGSYDTFTVTACAGTGLNKCGMYFDFAYSKGLTDGYIRNAFADVQSAYSTLGWMNERNSIRLIWLFGDQRTGITWNGIDLATYESDRRFNSAGMYEDDYGNIRYYDNDTDNYTQHHLQLNYTRSFGERILWSTTFNYTRGYGYYENYKSTMGESVYSFASFGFPSDFQFSRNEIVYDVDSSGDFIVREALANDYYVLNSDVRYKADKFVLTAGVNLSHYDGDHIGKVMWSDILGTAFDYASYEWYLNNGLKQEANVYARAEYRPLNKLTLYADLQYRGIRLNMSGCEYGAYLDYSANWQFFNPRAGTSFSWDSYNKTYFSIALGHREPGRADIKAYIDRASEDVSLKPEKMLDVEAGHTYSAENLTVAANVYMMEYWDMLLETGKLSNVGYAIKDNMGRGWRRGVELSASWQALAWMRLDANITLSVNRIKNYTAYFDEVTYIDGVMKWTGNQKKLDFGQTVMLMSPSVSGMMKLSLSPWRNIAINSLKTTTLSIIGKYVGKQYLDNTMTEESSVPSYFISDLSLSHEFALPHGRLGVSAYVSNIFNHMYYADGWSWNVYDADTGQLESYPGVYPQAPLNFMLKVSYRF